MDCCGGLRLPPRLEVSWTYCFPFRSGALVDYTKTDRSRVSTILGFVDNPCLQYGDVIIPPLMPLSTFGGTPHPPLTRSPFPSRGRTLCAAESGRDFPCWTRHFLYCGEQSVAALPGGAKPFAGRVGWRGLPLHTIKGADSGFRRTQCLHPRRAQRKAQVCGDSTVKSDGRRAGSPHPEPHPIW